ncbi:MAG: UDP-3-O-acyl-N-acetylglucosamine deacetylase [Deltaproteobacteria bacterium]|nr:UDP-3-O-acyl-N-acetylglucosamine deacetylase [Deltaproteobacteria bacterium]
MWIREGVFEAGDAALVFDRQDLIPPRVVEASLRHAFSCSRRTSLRQGGVEVQTVEHLLAACAGLGRFGVRVALEGSEVPILDGSARAFCQLLSGSSGAPRATEDSQECWRVLRPFEVRRGAARYRLEPSRVGHVVSRIDFAHPAIGRQEAAWRVGDHRAFIEEIAPARTFGFVEELETLRRGGLIQGATWDCALVFDPTGPLSEPRFEDEPARHKLLDLIGDLALLGAPLAGRLLAFRPSHALTLETLRGAIAAGALCFEGGGLPELGAPRLP